VTAGREALAAADGDGEATTALPAGGLTVETRIATTETTTTSAATRAYGRSPRS
jgi:hypothetical protein